MPDLDGIQLAKAIRSFYPNCKVFLFSGNAGTQEMLNKVSREGHAFEVDGFAEIVPVSPGFFCRSVLGMLGSQIRLDAGDGLTNGNACAKLICF